MKMTKHIILLSSILAISACQVSELKENSAVKESLPGRTVELKVTDQVKSSYQEGFGVNIDGTENIAVLYTCDGIMQKSLKATPSGSGKYSFTIPPGANPDEMFYGVMPYSPLVIPEETGEFLVKARIFPVQYPSATSFDPHYDFLSAEGFYVESGKAEITSFKRTVSPLRMKVKGLPENAKIRTAELSLSQGVSEENCTGLVGEAMVFMTDNFRKSAVKTLKNPGNTVSAVYPDGLADNNGEYDIWYVVNPSSLYADARMTVRVSVDTATFTKEIRIPSTAEIRRNELSQFAVDFSTGDVTHQTSVTFDFSKEEMYYALQSQTTISIKGSDGNTYSLPLSRTKCSVQGEEGLPCALQLSSPTGTGKFATVPFVPEKDVTDVRLFAQYRNVSSSTTRDSVFVIKGGRAVAKANVNMAKNQNETDYLGNTGGVATLSIPETGTLTLSGGQIQGTNGTMDFSAMTLLLRDKVTPVYDHNDYMSMFEAGLDIVIGGKVFNIGTHPTYTSIKMSDVTDNKPITNAFSTNGIVFIDNDDASKIFSATANLAFGTDAVIVGRYISGKGQPRICVTGGNKYMQVQNNLHLLNMQLENDCTYCFFTSKSGYSSVYTQDCTLLSTDAKGHGFARFNGAGVGFKDIVVDNCVFLYGNQYFLNNASAGSTADNFAKLTNLTIRNTVFIPLTGKADAVAVSVFKAPQNTSNASFTLENNSFYGMTATTPQAILALKTAKDVTVKDNVFYSETALTANLSHDLVSISGSYATKTVSGNWMNRYENGGFTFTWNPSADNYNTSAGPFFATGRLSDLYMPVDKSVVTTDAGASYDTKLWKTWNQ